MSLAAPVRGVVIDPACGYGTLLLAASQAATAQLTLIGQDINSDACHMTRLRMFVHGRPANIIHGDTLRAGTLFDDATLMDSRRGRPRHSRSALCHELAPGAR